jgi:hypothetical protein
MSNTPTVDIDSVSVDVPDLTSPSYSVDWNTINLGGNGAMGTTVGSNGTTGIVYTTNTTGVGSIVGGSYNWNVRPEEAGQIRLTGPNPDIKLGDRSLLDWMTRVEQRLNMLVPNPELEKEWDELRRLGERYRKLEKKCQQKAEMWNKLKSMPPIKTQK